MIALEDIARGAVLGLAAAAAPGPFQAVLVARSLRTGPWRALPLALVPVSSDPVAITTVLAGADAAPARLPPAGSPRSARGFALWMAVATLRAAVRGNQAGAGDEQVSRGFLAAAAVNVTNPNAWIFWSGVGGPLIASAWRHDPARAVAFVVSFFACLTAGNAALALLAGGIARAGGRAARGLGFASGVALLGFGAWQLVRLFLFP